MAKYIITITLGIALIIMMIAMSRSIIRKFDSLPPPSVSDSLKRYQVKTHDGYEPEILVVNLDDSLYHLPDCYWRGENIRYIYPRDAVAQGFKPCPECFKEIP